LKEADWQVTFYGVINHELLILYLNTK